MTSEPDGLEVLGKPPGVAPPLDHPRPFLVSVCPTAAGSSRAVDHISNIEYLRWLDRAAELHMDGMGWTRRDLLEDGHMWFVARHEIDYLAEVHAGDQLVLATWVRDLRRVKSWRDSVIWRIEARGDDEMTVVCRASTLWVHVDLETRKPSRVPIEMGNALDPLITRRGNENLA